MVSGQQLDIDGEGKDLTGYEIDLLVGHKTGGMFSAACYMGTVAAYKRELTKDETPIPFTFGHLLGSAFQITDDLLDIYSTSEEMGKTVGKDEKSGKSTYVSLLGAEETEKRAEFEIKIAKEWLNKLPESIYRDELFELCDYVLTRKN